MAELDSEYVEHMKREYVKLMGRVAEEINCIGCSPLDTFGNLV